MGQSETGQHDGDEAPRDEASPGGDEPVGPDGGAQQPAQDGQADDEALLERARSLAEVPLAERVDAFDALNRDVVAALRAIEDL